MFTRNQIGEALEYSEPSTAITKIHTKYQDRLNQFSVTTKLVGTDGKLYNTYLYSWKGVYEICRWSRQPKANLFMDFIWNLVEKFRTNEVVLSEQIMNYIDQAIYRILKEQLNYSTDQFIQNIVQKGGNKCNLLNL